LEKLLIRASAKKILIILQNRSESEIRELVTSRPGNCPQFSSGLIRVGFPQNQPGGKHHPKMSHFGIMDI